MLKTLVKSTIFLFLLMSYAHAVKIKNIEIVGNERISQETIILFGEIDKNQDFDEKSRVFNSFTANDCISELRWS